ncbi:MAG: reductive dehalogenase [Bacillota bacterium]|nr:reductive dehalogenase [Bacillota bacterium]
MPENLNRREFMKALGLTGAGVALTAGMTPEMVEATANNKPGEAVSKYWWVKNVDKPTTEIDWNAVKRYNEWETLRGSGTDYMGADRVKQLGDIYKEKAKKWELEGKPGYTTKDHALRAATGYRGNLAPSFLGAQKAQTPQERGMPRYEGTPEENSRIVRAALRHMGAMSVGFVELEDATTKKLIYNEDPAPSKKKILFQDVDMGYEEDDKAVIPNKARWVIVYSIQMDGDTMRSCPTPLGAQTTGLSYTRLWLSLNQLQEFIRGLGYTAYGPTRSNGLGIYPAFGVMAGLGEMSRTNRLVTPEYGPMVRLTMVVTDLPLAPTKPIDFGLHNFCKTCKICAELCPPRALSFDTEPSWKPVGPWNNAGHRAWFEHSVHCRNYQRGEAGTNCGICFSVCPYNKSDEASIHELWKATAAKTGAFNGTISKMDRAVYDSFKNPEDWWKVEDRAAYGIDTKAGKLRT